MERIVKRHLVLAFALIFAFSLLAIQAQAANEDTDFKGKIGRTLADSEEYWPEPVT